MKPLVDGRSSAGHIYLKRKEVPRVLAGTIDLLVDSCFRNS